MYTPRHNREEDPARLCDFMREYSFAALVTTRAAANGGDSHAPHIHATHLPFLIEREGDSFKLFAHIAKANPQWRDFDGAREALVIFQEPHAYISPRHYDEALSVPTWNYVAVHAYGAPVPFQSDEEKLRLLRRMIEELDADYLARWDEMPARYVTQKLGGIVAFHIEVTRLEARFKLSQDRSIAERERIVSELSASADRTRSRLGELMKEDAQP
ncbi:MAG TPA: FMN-binding negative transcriptional regulator [Pyrinomonadaceae bacterium]|nr:FMN-binding negative transcriptional regulator [Pyrinomonadaceae bacterium]